MQSRSFPDDLTSLISQGFLTDHEQALETLYADDAENSRHFNICLNMMATRIATVFASLKVYTFYTHSPKGDSLRLPFIVTRNLGFGAGKLFFIRTLSAKLMIYGLIGNSSFSHISLFFYVCLGTTLCSVSSC